LNDFFRNAKNELNDIRFDFKHGEGESDEDYLIRMKEGMGKEG
jgi:hypothetical protein